MTSNPLVPRRQEAPAAAASIVPAAVWETPVPVDERGDWIATARGQMWSIEHPHPADVHLGDIACGLARHVRYGGQMDPRISFYSVAEHSVLMTDWAIATGLVTTREDALAILLHDAAEAFWGDMPTPMKKKNPVYDQLEKHCQSVIITAFGLDRPGVTEIVKAQIKEIDIRIRRDERKKMILEPAYTMGERKGERIRWAQDERTVPLGIEVPCLGPDQARDFFIAKVFEVCRTLPARVPDCPLIEKQLGHLQDLVNYLNDDYPEYATGEDELVP